MRGKSAAVITSTKTKTNGKTPPNTHKDIPRNQHHYRSFADTEAIYDYHTRKRDHSGLSSGSLDGEGILAHTDFDIDLSRIDPDNDEHFQEYCERRKKFEEQLKLFYEKTERQ